MKAALPENAVEVPASVYWPFGLHIEPPPKGLLLRPARKPRAGWAKAFRANGKCSGDYSNAVNKSKDGFERNDW